MSSQCDLPLELRRCVEGLRNTTLELVRAVEDNDLESLERALTQRGETIDALRPQVETFRKQTGARAEPILVEVGAEIENDAADAFQALRKMRGSTQAVIAKVAREAVAIRSYGESLPSATALDRRG